MEEINGRMDVFPPEMAVMPYVEWLRLFIEVIGVIVIAIGVVTALWKLLAHLHTSYERRFHDVRLVLARYLALGLEFQLASDIISTAIAPSWERIGKLAAIAVMRTGLNFFLMREMEHENRSQPSI